MLLISKIDNFGEIQRIDMKVNLIERKTKKIHTAEITIAKSKDIPFKKDGWKFNWRNLYKTDSALILKISLLESPNVMEGMMMLTILFDEMVYMDNVEVAPHNYGKNKKFENVAGSLIAFACLEAFIIGKNAYNGFLSFTSKTELIELYAQKYGAIIAMNSRMYIDSEIAKKLINQYLKIKL